MDPEEKIEIGDDSKEFGKVIDALHNKSKLPSLRTYQGDMAEFIKSKNESVISIAVKEKEREEEKIEEEVKVKEEVKKEEKEVKENLYLTPKPISNKEGYQINFTILLSSIILIAGGAIASLYIYEFIKKEPPVQIVTKTEIIPYNNLITLANLTGKNLGTELAKLSPSGGINILKISDTSGKLLLKSKDFFEFLGTSLPATLGRTIKDEYVVGLISQNNQISYFLVFSINDFGRAFSGMLEWEKNMANDLSFLEGNSKTATSTPEVFVWKDIIIKNKDTRALVNEKNQAKIAYTFLDKNTILIVNSLWAIGDISSTYASRSVAR